MKKLSIILLLLAPAYTWSQSFSWGLPVPISDETEAEVTYYYENNKLYKFYSKYDLSIFNYKLLIEQFSANELERTAKKDLSVKQPAMGLNLLTHRESFYKGGTEFTFFSYEIDRKTKKNKLSWQTGNIEDASRSELSPITSIQGPNISNSGNWFINASPNQNYFVVLKELPFVKKSNEKIGLVLLDKDKKVVKEKTHTFSFIDKRNKRNRPYVSNTGKVFFIKDIKLKKEKPYKILYYWNPENNQVKEYKLKLDDDYQLYQYKVNFDENNDMILNALFTHNGSATVSLSIDLNGNASGTPSDGVLSVKIKDNGALAYQKRNDFDIISNMNLKDFVLKDDVIWLLADRMYIEKKSKGENIAQGNVKYDYNYQNTGFIIGNINPQTGELAWINVIKDEEPKTKNDNGEYLSYLHFFQGDNLVMLYNDTRNLRKAKINNPLYRRFPIMAVYDKSGKLVVKKDLLAAGIGVQKEEEFELDTSTLLKIDEKTYIIRAKSRVEYKYGYMKFN